MLDYKRFKHDLSRYVILAFKFETYNHFAEILKRLDDPTDSIRISAAKVLSSIFMRAPKEFKSVNYKGHHEMIIDTYLTHLDDDDGNLQKILTGNCLP